MAERGVLGVCSREGLTSNVRLQNEEHAFVSRAARDVGDELIAASRASVWS